MRRADPIREAIKFNETALNLPKFALGCPKMLYTTSCLNYFTCTLLFIGLHAYLIYKDFYHNPPGKFEHYCIFCLIIPIQKLRIYLFFVGA